ncbi:YciI family protein [Paenarthrobacter sp. NPDC058040]|uniref:YciI family protein n=1 Tax=unclassified Paenarthrobacter TaxID=2634190 RepID=UPI0036D8D93F
MSSLFVIDLNYVVDLTMVERHLDDHRDFLQGQYESGFFLASGRKEPWTGGVILAAGTRAEIMDILEKDPFLINAVAEYSVTEFLATKTSSALARYRHPV